MTRAMEGRGGSDCGDDRVAEHANAVHLKFFLARVSVDVKEERRRSRARVTASCVRLLRRGSAPA